MPPEEIENAHLLFRQVREPQHINPANGELSSATFGDTEMSVDWEKLSTPEQTGQRDPRIRMVVALQAGFCRNVPLTVKRDPLTGNDFGGPNAAHALIIGKKTGSVKLKLKTHAQLVWERG